MKFSRHTRRPRNLFILVSDNAMCRVVNVDRVVEVVATFPDVLRCDLLGTGKSANYNSYLANGFDDFNLQGYNSHMKVGTAELKNNLSRYMRRARAGKHTIITDRGRPVAKLVPIDDGELIDVHEKLAALAASGVIEYPTADRRFARVARVAVPHNAASAAVNDQRG